MSWLLGLELIDGGIIPFWGLLTTALVVLVVVARRGRTRRLAVGAAVGAVVGVVLVVLSDVSGAFDVALPGPTAAWVAVGLATAGLGVAAITQAGWGGRSLAALLVLTSLVLGGLGVNREFGITHTLATILGVQALPAVALPARTPASTDQSPISSTWTPPAGMPAKGEVGALSGDRRIPSPGYSPRDAAIYLPPAALVAHPPRLPLLVFMMGQPGSPDPTALANALDAFAASHRGLAPIAIVADQLTAPELDPACQDSAAYGAVSSYFNVSIPAYARAHLNVLVDPTYWAIGGYSNGGSCALLFGSRHPEIWGSILDVSGNQYPGDGSDAQTIAKVFAGDAAAFAAAKPAAVMAAHAGDYAGHTAVFTAGALDTRYGPGQRANAAAARAAGFTTVLDIVPGASHVGPALSRGLALGVAALAAPLGLAPGDPGPSALARAP
ncbi:alpha/beta hydrolase-fold protein [Microbacterium sp. AZCO]|uniref:alpha/beta hydrolase n=1 Tax=Microbacterium sp. AZCO TaxID=3142976 RepID=UPI0031F3A2C6